ncbi:SIS domain-containing protein [Actinoplanes sp. TFC3]|uniref:SIS domain-containing protein n=1 Tax=Actinoplanes sp. TFC3 TaxID=1710355 RepID=UPI00082DE80B|nr:sugar isomerase [Actinoplanes sp. TFC3]
MSHVRVEIASQPDCWRQAAKLAGSAGLPVPGERVAVAGCGTSWFMAQSYAGLREREGHGETDAFQASEFPYGRKYDRVIAITRSGTTTEVVDLLAALRGKIPTTVITADPEAPVAAIADEAIVLDFADELSVVQTRFATSTLALLRAHLGHDIEALAADGDAAVRLPLPVHPALAEQITFLGRGWTVGLAEDAALKCREAAEWWAEAYPAMEYRHGPIALGREGRVVWAFGEVPEGLSEEVEATGAAFVHSQHNGGYWGAGEREGFDPMADLVVAQRVAVLFATSQGLDPDHPRGVTRSVVLP